MKIRLLAFATAREALGSDELEIDLPGGSGLADLAERLRRDHPRLGPIWERLAIAVDGELADEATALHDGCEVALLPPVSGGAPQSRAELTERAIDVEEIASTAASPACGALLLFVGRVRDHHRAKEVAKITYDAYRPMALRALETIAAELEASSPSLIVRIAHRLGSVAVGEASVVIAVAAPHRAAAYAASREALERLKREAPIWKQEHYADGESVWREVEPLAGKPARAAD